MQINNYEAPQADLSGAIETTNVNVVLASRWARLGAAIIDCLIMIPITIASSYFILQIIEHVTPDAPIESALFIFIPFAIVMVNLLIFIIINGRSLLVKGQTVGKRMCNIKIVDKTGALSAKKRIVLRYAFSFALPVVPILGALLALINNLCVFTPSKRCLHDRVAGTQVINDFG